MSASSSDSYLMSEIQTNAPQRRQLMLIEAAIRFCRSAQDFLGKDSREEAADQIARAANVVTELLAALNPEPAPELVGKVAGVYLFVLRTLTAANLEADPQKLAEALRVLEVERETWRQLCAQCQKTDAAGPHPNSDDSETPRSDSPASTRGPTATSSGFSLEA